MSNLTDAQQSIGSRVRDARAAVDLSREGLARDVLASTSTIVRLERDNQLPNVVTLARIARRLHLSLDDLLAELLEPAS